MRYLGGIRGAGTLQCGNETLARADYDLDGYTMRPGEVTGSGEIRMAPEFLRQVFRRKNLQLVTKDGRRLDLRFSEKELASGSSAAHVDVAGELPKASEWRS